MPGLHALWVMLTFAAPLLYVRQAHAKAPGITRVRNAAELRTALRAGDPHIIITQHLDLTRPSGRVGLVVLPGTLSIQVRYQM
jgi:hypothetical protein